VAGCVFLDTCLLDVAGYQFFNTSRDYENLVLRTMNFLRTAFCWIKSITLQLLVESRLKVRTAD
jgi:hypothetical protein